MRYTKTEWLMFLILLSLLLVPVAVVGGIFFPSIPETRRKRER